MIDLHLHSTSSDGSETPSRIVDLAAEAGCSTIALTDHDGLGGLETARARASALGVGFIEGCEVSCTDDIGTIHLLVYFVTEGGSFDRSLQQSRDDRARRNSELLDKLRWLGMPLDPAELAAEAGAGTVGRPHVAALLVRHGYATSVNDAFGRFLGDGRPAFVERAPLSPLTVIDRARAEGAVVSFAHPLTTGLDPTSLERYVTRLEAGGLGGLEAFYGRYGSETRASLVALARRTGLVPTGGSDFHGSYKPDLSVGTGLGDLHVPDDVVDELEALRAAPA